MTGRISQKIGLGFGFTEIVHKGAADRIMIGKNDRLQPSQLGDAHFGVRCSQGDRRLLLSRECPLDLRASLHSANVTSAASFIGSILDIQISIETGCAVASASPQADCATAPL